MCGIAGFVNDMPIDVKCPVLQRMTDMIAHRGPDSEGHYIRQERATGSCARSFYVGKELEPKDISAKFENGILSLHLPKAEAKRIEPKQTLIEIE